MLIRELQPYYSDPKGRKWPFHNTVLASLWTSLQRSGRFNTSKSLICTHVHEVCFLISDHLSWKIWWPTHLAVHDIEQGFLRAGFPKTLCAADGCHIPTKKPQGVEIPETYFNRKHFYSVNLTAFCNNTARFIHINVGYPGSWHDAHVFRMTEVARLLLENLQSLLPGDLHITGDTAYPLSQFLMTPFRDNGHLTVEQKRYNQRHSSARMVIERAFGLLKTRFRRLKGLHMHNLLSLAVTACCILHNICLETDCELQINALQCLSKQPVSIARI
ncbi:protein ANTAGONIST OF LIKE HETEROCHROMATIN PROTEIN 1-like isoform X1 [Huso huso]|uniref:Protein ANTAGONIST OF LIKE HETEROCHROMATIN PROTEIN 1-like isoform X1 n=1 Tax=Huso huso TaxID=61971 RepID=A0ABR1A9R7_HUSHU